MPAWPGTLPDKQFLEGLVYEPVPQALVTEMEVGPPKSRRRSSGRRARVSIPMLLDGAEMQTFLTFFNTTLEGGSLTFTWRNPLTGATVTYLFAQPTAWRPIAAHETAASPKRLWSGVMLVWEVG